MNMYCSYIVISKYKQHIRAGKYSVQSIPSYELADLKELRAGAKGDEIPYYTRNLLEKIYINEQNETTPMPVPSATGGDVIILQVYDYKFSHEVEYYVFKIEPIGFSLITRTKDFGKAWSIGIQKLSIF